METLTKSEKTNKRRGMVFSIVIHTVLLLLAGLYGFTFQIPPPEAGGTLVHLGIPDAGTPEEGTEPARTPESAAPEEQETSPPAEPVKEKVNPEPSKKSRPDVLRTEDPDADRIEKDKEEKEQKELQEQLAAQERIRQQQQEAQKIAAEEADKKNKLEGLFKQGGNGKKQPGEQGDPNGDPNAANLEGIASGAGILGDGLSNRGVLRKGPSIRDNSQEKGVVVINLCVDRNGDVIGEPTFTQKGSTTADSRLIDLAIRNARQWKFQKGSVDKQCGTIRYDFKLQ